MVLKLDKEICRFMISSPCYFVSDYLDENIYITSAQPLSNQENIWDNIKSNAHARNFFVISFNSLTTSSGDGLSNFEYIVAKRIMILISIFFGKKVDGHGFVQWYGNFWAPDMSDIAPNKYFYIGPYNQLARKDLDDKMGIRARDWLNWDKLEALRPLIENINEENEFNRFLFTAGEYYLHSLQSLSRDPEIAYLDLIMCGEILSNFHQFTLSEKELYAKEILDLLSEISSLSDGDKKVKLIKDSLLSIKRRYSKTIFSLLNNYFFQNTVNDLSQTQRGSLKYVKKISRDSAEKNIKASYDLRNKFIHTGFSFGNYIIPHSNLISEVQTGTPVIPGADKKVVKIIRDAPTFVGLERLMRYCLLRFIQKYGGVHIDDRLNDD